MAAGAVTELGLDVEMTPNRRLVLLCWIRPDEMYVLRYETVPFYTPNTGPSLAEARAQRRCEELSNVHVRYHFCSDWMTVGDQVLTLLYPEPSDAPFITDAWVEEQ